MAHELRTPYPLVNLRLMRNRAVLTANTTGLFAGLGMYMLLPLVTRYVQAPTSTGYGFGVSVVVAGLVLLPFSVASVSASRLLPIGGPACSAGGMVLPLGALFLVASMLIFLFARTELWESFLVHGGRRARHRADLRGDPRVDRAVGAGAAKRAAPSASIR